MSSIHREFVASCYVFSQSCCTVLLIHHPKLHVWLPAGGHVEKNELFHEAAIREVQEETGYDVVLFCHDPVQIDESNAISIPRPFLCLLENVPAWNQTLEHQHIDMVYIGYIRHENANVCSSSLHQTKELYRWFSEKEIEALQEGKEIFKETKTILKYLFKNHPLCSEIGTL